jgi:hypothetical protein
MRLSLPLFIALFLTACGNTYTASLPDGGRGRVTCTGDLPSVPVLVIGPAGEPAAGATVTATWLSYDDTTQSQVSDARGIALIAAQFGPGVVRVKATLNDLASPVAEVTFAGGECISAVTPSDVRLHLR